jgi:hypothetical protein
MKTRRQKHIRSITYKKLRHPILTTIIPKGTLLFRGVKDIKSDFAGIPQKDGSYKLTPYHNVFFYPYPFVADLDRSHYNDFSHYNNTVEVYETLHPIHIISLIAPSHYTRAERMRNTFLTNCNNVYKEGREYDPCFTKEFLYKFPRIMGMEAVGRDDGLKFHEALKNLPEKEKKYLHWSSNTRKEKPTNSIKEYILYPLQKRYDKSIKDVDAWRKDKKDEFNYRYLTSLSREDQNKEIHEFMETKARFNPSTKLWSLKH